MANEQTPWKTDQWFTSPWNHDALLALYNRDIVIKSEQLTSIARHRLLDLPDIEKIARKVIDEQA